MIPETIHTTFQSATRTACSKNDFDSYSFVSFVHFILFLFHFILFHFFFRNTKFGNSIPKERLTMYIDFQQSGIHPRNNKWYVRWNGNLYNAVGTLSTIFTTVLSQEGGMNVS